MTSPPPGPGNGQGDVPERVRGSTPIVAMSGPPTTLDTRSAEAVMDHDIASESPTRRPPPWSSPFEACALVARGYTFRTGAVVASVVGTLLSGVNEGTVIASGHLDVFTWARIATNYLVPFVVASVGYLAPFRHRRGTNR